MLVVCKIVAVASLLLSASTFGQVGPYASQQAKLTTTDSASGDRFGSAVAVSGETAVVGASGNDSAGENSGAAYVLVRTGVTWNQQAKLTALDAAPDDSFGIAVAISGDTVLVGAYSDDNAAGPDAGAAYVFVRAGTVWTQQAKLTAMDASMGDRFGGAVAVVGDTVVIGAHARDHDGVIDAGAAYVFVRNGTTWTQQAKLVAADSMNSDVLGISVALSGQTAVVGAQADASIGSAYVFVRNGASWAQQAKLTAPDVLSGDIFGGSVSVSGDTAIVGAMQIYNSAIGAAYVFQRTGTTWTQQAKLTASDAASGDLFGFAVAVAGDLAIVGANVEDNGGGTDAGSAYCFERSGTVWQERAKLIASDAAAGDRFGYSVALSGCTVISGAFEACGKGAAYAFLVEPMGTWSDLGLGLAGMSGIPTLAGGGCLAASSPVTLSLTGAKPFSLAPLVVGLSNLSVPFKGGVLVPYPSYIFPAFTDFFGKSTFGGLWPAGIHSGFTTYFQWWIQDSAAPQGYAASNAVAGTSP